MIRIEFADDKNDTTSLFIGIAASHPVESVLWFQRKCASTVERNLLAAHLKKQIYDRMVSMRRISYLRGWRDKASKKAKCVSFTVCTDIAEWEYRSAGLR